MPNVPVRIDQLGPHAQVVQRAREDREEIVRLLNTMPADERKRMPDVANSAIALVGKMEAISAGIASMERELQLRPVADVDAEITKLEAEANPLDTQASEARVRRLAQLRRERRAATEGAKRLDARKAQLETCRLALETVRLDLVRLRTGNSSVQSVTLIAEQAMALAQQVDVAVAAAREVQEATREKSRA
jgi:serine/threonine-protein kinase